MKATTCDWCGGDIGKLDIRVRLPNHGYPGGSTYHADCYCRVYTKQCLRAIIADDYPHGENVGKALGIVLRALDPKEEHADDCACDACREQAIRLYPEG